MDNDGITDSYDFGATNMALPWYWYNCHHPRHNRGGLFLFASGAVRWVSVVDFVTNKNALWGDGHDVPR
jgi:hypothetical protein